MRISSKVLTTIGEHARATYPEECCGLLLGTISEGGARVHESIAVNNEAEAGQKKKRYFVEPRKFLAADRLGRQQGLEVLGVYHSHPDHAATPSATDTELAWECFFYLIVAINSQGVTELRGWEFVGGQPREEFLVIE